MRLPLEPAGHRHAACQALERAPGCRLGDVLAPQGLALAALAAKLVAVTGPQNAIMLCLQHLDRAARKTVSPEHFVLRVGAAAKADGHEASRAHLPWGSPVDYLCIPGEHARRPEA